MMDFSCGLHPDDRSPELAVLAESLGYRRVWVYDSPALGADVWVTLARIAERTSRIGLGPGVLVPSLRHVMVTAAALATVEAIAPGRVARPSVRVSREGSCSANDRCAGRRSQPTCMP